MSLIRMDKLYEWIQGMKGINGIYIWTSSIDEQMTGLSKHSAITPEQRMITNKEVIRFYLCVKFALC